GGEYGVPPASPPYTGQSCAHAGSAKASTRQNRAIIPAYLAVNVVEADTFSHWIWSLPLLPPVPVRSILSCSTRAGGLLIANAMAPTSCAALRVVLPSRLMPDCP